MWKFVFLNCFEMKILATTLSLLHVALALHCWKDADACRGNSTTKFGSSCDTPKNRIKNMRVFGYCLRGYCHDSTYMEWRARSGDRSIAKPSGVACFRNFHSNNASSYGDIVAGCVSARYPKLLEKYTIVCCEAGVNEGCK